MSAITKERIELFIKNPLDNGLTSGEQMEVARIALASLEAEPVVYMWDSERKDIDAPGYYRTEHLVFAENSVKQWGGRVVPLYTAQPVPVTPDGWISCSERMPKGYADVLVTDGEHVEVKWWDESGYWNSWTELNSDIFADEITHWMPLPEPPQEVNRG